MKRGISFLLACTFMLTLGTSLLTGCSSQNEYMQNGEWLYLINEKFGFSYPDEKTYETSVDIANEYYNDVQIAYGYGVLPEEMTDIETSASLTNELCALTLAGAIYEPNISEVDIADINKTDYADAVITIVNEGIMPLTSGNKFQPSKKIKYEDAVEYLDRAYYSWVNHHYDPYVDYTLNENVVDFSGLSTVYSYEKSVEVTDNSSFDDSGNPVTHTETNTEYTVDEVYVENQRKWLSDNDFNYNEDKGIVTLNDISDKGIKEGSILTIPDTLEYPTGLYLKVENITQDSDGEYELQVVPAEIADVFEGTVSFEMSKPIDFSQCVIYDADGNILSSGKYGNENTSISPMSYSDMAATLSMSKDIKIPLPGGLEGKLLAKDGSITLSVADKNNTSGGGNTGTKETDSTSFSVEFSNMVCNTCEFENYKLFGLDTGVLNPDGYHKLSLSYDTKIKGSLVHKWESDSSQTKNSLGVMLNSSFTKFSKFFDKKTLNNHLIATIPVPLLPGIAAEFDLYMRVTLEGEVSFSFGFSDGSVVFESRHLKPTFSATIGDLSSKSVSGSIKAELAPQLYLCFAIANVDVIDVAGEIGIGAKAEAKLTEVYDGHTALSDPVQLQVDAAAACINILKDKKDSSVMTESEDSQVLFCLDLTAYKILDFTFCSGKSLIGKALEFFKVDKFQYKIWDEKTAKLLTMHLEGGTDTAFDSVNACTLSDRIDGLIEHGDHLEISPLNDVIVEEGETVMLDITMLPHNKHKYYLTSDLKAEVEDDAIAIATIGPEKDDDPAVNVKWWDAFKKLIKITKDEDKIEKVKITGVKEGSTSVSIHTIDNQYDVSLNITVVPKEVDINEYMAVSIDTYFIGVTVNDTAKVNVVSVPIGKTFDDVIWKIDDTNIAHVDSFTGEITGLSEGNCTVKAFIPGYEDSAVYCLVTVSKDYLATNTANSSGTSKQWIKIEGQPVIILERA